MENIDLLPFPELLEELRKYAATPRLLRPVKKDEPDAMKMIRIITRVLAGDASITYESIFSQFGVNSTSLCICDVIAMKIVGDHINNTIRSQFIKYPDFDSSYVVSVDPCNSFSISVGTIKRGIYERSSR